MGAVFFRLFLLYLLEGSKQDNQTIVKKIIEISTNTGTEALSAADQFRLEGKKEIIQKMLLVGKLSVNDIVQYTGTE